MGFVQMLTLTLMCHISGPGSVSQTNFKNIVCTYTEILRELQYKTDVNRLGDESWKRLMQGAHVLFNSHCPGWLMSLKAVTKSCYRSGKRRSCRGSLMLQKCSSMFSLWLLPLTLDEALLRCVCVCVRTHVCAYVAYTHLEVDILQAQVASYTSAGSTTGVPSRWVRWFMMITLCSPGMKP